MNKKELQQENRTLKKNIETLELLVESQERLIEALRANHPYHYPQINVPYVQTQDLCTDGREHEYPMPWHSVTSPHCQKCGKQAPNFDITFTTSDTGTGNINVGDGGYNWTVLDNLQS
jgi:hypothetical protein